MEPLTKSQKEAMRAHFQAMGEAMERVRAEELASMTEERARQIIDTLWAYKPWRERPDWSGLVEQQALFHRKKL